MTLIEKIKRSFGNQNYHFGTAEELNIVANGNIDFPAIFLYRPENWSSFDCYDREKSTFLVFFCDSTSYSYSTDENHRIVEECKERALEWVNSLNLYQIFAETTRVKPVYLEFSTYVTGVMVEVSLRETYPNEANCEQF